MEKTLVIGGEEIKMRASALIPRIYRFKFGRDLIRDMKELERNYKKAVGDIVKGKRMRKHLWKTMKN